jgi:outer membrane protein OmpA-like peptidoglycan-associated protein
MISRVAAAVLFALFMVAVTARALASTDEEKYQFKILDLVYVIQDLGGRVEDFAIRETDLDVRLQLNADVLFDFDKADVLPKAEDVLRKAADYLQQHGGKGAIRIEGHTDAKGDDDYNLRLSRKRADAVRDWLARKGSVPSSRMTSNGLGEKNPIAPNTKPDGSDDVEGRAKNRRVEIVITK